MDDPSTDVCTVPDAAPVSDGDVRVADDAAAARVVPVVPVSPTVCEHRTDILDEFTARLRDILVQFADEVLDSVRDAKGVDVEDVRASLVGPLRRHKKRRC